MDSDVNPFSPHGELNDVETRIMAVLIGSSLGAE